MKIVIALRDGTMREGNLDYLTIGANGTKLLIGIDGEVLKIDVDRVNFVNVFSLDTL